MGILSRHGSWLLHYSLAIKVYFDGKIVSTKVVSLYVCPEHLDWQAEDTTSVELHWISIHPCTNKLSACASWDTILFFTMGRVYTLQSPASSWGLPNMSACSAGEHLLFASQQACYCCLEPTRTQIRTGQSKAVRSPPNWEDAKECRKWGGRENNMMVRQKGKELKIRQEKKKSKL